MNYLDNKMFEEITDGLETELVDSFEVDITDGYDTHPRPLAPELTPDAGNIPRGHIALMGDFEADS